MTAVQPEPPPWREFTADSLAGLPVPPRDWVVDGLIPGANVTLLGGDGGVGKSSLALQLAFAVASGQEWLGHRPSPGRAVYLSAEDDTAELHRRLDELSAFYGSPLEQLQDLDLLDVTEAPETLLVAQDPRTSALGPTGLLRALEAKIVATRPRLVVLDSLADLYGGNENDRAHVRHFVALLRRLGQAHGPAVLLLGHPSLSGLSSGNGFSGSTAWNNSVRSRLYLEQGKDEQPDARVLSVKKANYAARAPELRLRRGAGGFELQDRQQVALATAANEARVDALFLELLLAHAASGRRVRPSRGRGYAPAEFASDPRAQGVTKEGFAAAMARLFARDALKVVETGPPSGRTAHIEPA